MADTRIAGLVQNRTVLIVSLGLGVLAVVLVNVYVSGVESRLMRGSFLVLKTTDDLKRNERLKESSVERVRVPGTFKDAFEQAWGADDLASLVGRRVAVDVKRGEILFHSHFEAHRSASAADTIPRGFRHAAIRVDSRRVPAGLAPGSFVDIIGNVRFSATGTPMPMTVMRGVKLVAIESLLAAPDDPTKARRSSIDEVTIEITPDELTKLQAVELRTEGEFRLADRNPADVPLDTSDRFDEKLKPLFASLRAEGPPAN